jgi:hypothetical protein
MHVRLDVKKSYIGVEIWAMALLHFLERRICISSHRRQHYVSGFDQIITDTSCARGTNFLGLLRLIKR